MKIDKAIRLFAIFLNNSFTSAYPFLIDRNYTTNDSSINDWLQANWEILVERKVLNINEYLEVYGDEADFNGESSRITDPEAIATYRIGVNGNGVNKVFDVLNNENIELDNLIFDKLVGFKNGYYTKEPAFNYVLLIDKSGSEKVVLLSEVKFDLVLC